MFTLEAIAVESKTVIPDEINRVLQDFLEFFSKPKSLPPNRGHDHSIPIKLDVNPVSIRPYRYNYFQKHKIEKQVNEMLHNGIIQPSHSPFSSLVLLVKKMVLGGFALIIGNLVR